MTRVSTFGNYQSALLDLMAAQTRSHDAQQRVSTQKNATDLTGFGRGSETLTALKSMQSRIQGFIDTGEAVAARLTSQDMGFQRVIEGASGAREALANALANGRLDGLMLEIQGQFQVSQDGLNAKHQGRHLFSGADVNNAPVAVSTLADLALAPTAASVFGNDTLKSSSRLDEGSSLQTSFLANEIGTELFEVFRDLQTYQNGDPVSITDPDTGVTTVYTPTGPGLIDGQPGPAVRDFLNLQLSRFDRARIGVTDMAARNGSLQNRVESILDSHGSQSLALDELVGERTDADMAKAITDLELSKIAIQASAQVLNQLRDVSLLNFLR